MESAHNSPRRNPSVNKKNPTSDSETSRHDLRTLLKFRNKIEINTNSEIFSPHSNLTPYQTRKYHIRSPYRKSTKNKPLPTPGCILHPRTSSHSIIECREFKEMHFHKRISVLRKRNVCLRCTGLHNTKFCRVKLKCNICKGGHLSILHDHSKDPPTKQNPLALVPYKPPNTTSPRSSANRSISPSPSRSPSPTKHASVPTLLHDLHKSLSQLNNSLRSGEAELSSSSIDSIDTSLRCLEAHADFFKKPSRLTESSFAKKKF